MEMYNAGLISQSFWFVEFKKIVKLISSGYDYGEIRDICINENIFGVANAYRAKRITGYLMNRSAALDIKEIQLFMESDIATQKLLNLITILRNDRLFFEFLFEVYREKIILGFPHLEDSDINIFFRKKEAESPAVNKWKESTKSHLRQSYINCMANANLLAIDCKIRRITPPILDAALEGYLNEKGDGVMVKAITGRK